LNMYRYPRNKFVAGFIGSPAMNFFEGTISKGRHMTFAEDGGGVSFDVPAPDVRILKGYAGKRIVAGLRPENISILRANGNRSSAGEVKAHVEVVEPMGNEIFVYFTTSEGRTQHVARCSPEETPVVGRDVKIAFDRKKVHYFNGESEIAISRAK
jgi:multiple sugar transport system ATP-binding protein